MASAMIDLGFVACFFLSPLCQGTSLLRATAYML